MDCHLMDFLASESLLQQRLEESQQTLRMHRVDDLTEITRKNATGGANGSNRCRVISDHKFLVGPDQTVV